LRVPFSQKAARWGARNELARFPSLARRNGAKNAAFYLVRTSVCRYTNLLRKFLLKDKILSIGVLFGANIGLPLYEFATQIPRL